MFRLCRWLFLTASLNPQPQPPRPCEKACIRHQPRLIGRGRTEDAVLRPRERKRADVGYSALATSQRMAELNFGCFAVDSNRLLSLKQPQAQLSLWHALLGGVLSWVPEFSDRTNFKLVFTVFYRTQVSWSDLCVWSLKLTFVKLYWCDSDWWRYQLNTNWYCQ